MGMTRDEVFEMINNERRYQDAQYPPDLNDPSGLLRAERDKNPVAGILMLEEYADKARKSWVDGRGPQSRLTTLRMLAKLASVAVRVLERAENSELLLVKGLR